MSTASTPTGPSGPTGTTRVLTDRTGPRVRMVRGPRRLLLHPLRANRAYDYLAHIALGNRPRCTEITVAAQPARSHRRTP
jgi:hypothetical protein